MADLSTPVRLTSAKDLSEDLFDGVPGAPDRKPRSQASTKERTEKDRQAKVKGVAKRLAFDQDDQPDQESSRSAISKRRGIAPTKPSSDCVFLGPSIQLRKKAKTPNPSLKRSYSSSTSMADLLDVNPNKRNKSTRTTEIQSELNSHPQTKLYTSMRRAISASSKFESNRRSDLDKKTLSDGFYAAWRQSPSPHSCDILRLETPPLVDMVLIR